MNSADIPKTGVPGPGTVLGQYRLEKLIAQGGMGWVFSAHELTLDRLVAVKVLAPHLMADADAVRSFRQEARAAANLAHNNVVRIYAAGEQDGLAFFVTEFVGGTDLATLLRDRGYLEPREAMQLVRQAAMGLQHAHWNGIIHGDVKPDNLLLDESGCIKVTDFGLARWLGAAPAADGHTHLFCSPEYVSPETVAGRPADQRSDIYSLGATLYRLLTGSPPFEGDPDSLLLQHLNAVPAPAASRKPGIPADVNDLVMATLAKDPANRPQDYDAFLTALDRCIEPAAQAGKKVIALSKRPAAARLKASGSPGASDLSKGSGARSRAMVAAVAVIVVAAVAIVVLHSVQSAREAERRARLAADAVAAAKASHAAEDENVDKEAARTLAELRKQASSALAGQQWGAAWEALSPWDSNRYAGTASQAAWQAERQGVLDGAKQAWTAVQAKAADLCGGGRLTEALDLYDSFAEDCRGVEPVLELMTEGRRAMEEAARKAADERETKLRALEQSFHGQVLALRWDEAWQALRQAGGAATNDPTLGASLALLEKQAEGLVELRDAVLNRLNVKSGHEVSLSTTRGIVRGYVVVASSQSVTVRQTLASSAVAETQVPWSIVSPVSVAQLYANFVDPTNVVQRRGFASLLVHLALDRQASADAARREVKALVNQAPEEEEVFARYLDALPAAVVEDSKTVAGDAPRGAVPAGPSKVDPNSGGPFEPLDISKACNVHAIRSAASRALRDEMRAPTDGFGGNGWTTDDVNRMIGSKEEGIPANGRIPIPTAVPKAHFRVLTREDANAIYLSPQEGNYPASVTCELPKKQQQRYSRMALLFASNRGGSTVSLTIQYETGDSETRSLRIPNTFTSQARNANQNVAFTTTGAGRPRNLYSEIVAIDAGRALKGFTFTWESGPRDEDPVDGVFAVSAWPVEKGRPRLQSTRPSPE